MEAIAYATAWVAKALIGVGVNAGIAKVVATVAVQMAVAAGTQAASNALRKKSLDYANRLLDPEQYNVVNADTLSSRVVMYGESGIAGECVFQMVHADKEWISYVITLADNGQPIPHQLTKVEMDGEIVTFTDGEATGKYAGLMKLRFYGGVPDQTADDILILNSGGVWTEDHRGRGVCYVVWSCKLSDQEAFPNGRPNPMFTIKGRALYDRRKDSTYPGGDGDHRIDDPATWEWDDNAALVADDFARGVFFGETPRRIAGLGLPLDLIDESWTVASSNASDEEGWRICGPVDTEADPADVLKTFELHMGGRIITRRGKLAIIAGYDWPSVLTITEDDLAGKFKGSPYRSWRDINNSVKVAYRDATVNYEAVETDLIEVGDWVAQDNDQTFEKPVSTPFENDRVKATRIGKMALFKERAPRSFEQPLKLRCGRVYEGDIVTLYLPSYDISETYEVISRSLNPMGFVTLALKLWNADGLEWSDSEAGDPPPWGVIDRPDFTPPIPTEFIATPVTVGTDENGRPAIDVTGLPPQWITGVIVHWRLLGETEWTFWGEIAPIEGKITITGLAPNSTYEISILYKHGTKLSGERQIVVVTTPGDATQDAANIMADVVARIAAIAAETRARLIELGYADGIPVGAVIRKEQTLRESADEVLARDITLVAARMTDAETDIDAQASAMSVLTARVTDTEDGISAVASSVDTLETTVGEHTATITEYGESIDGIAAKAGVVVNVNGEITGWETNNDGDSGDFRIFADNFKMVSAPGGTPETPFEVVGGVTRMKAAFIKALSVNGKFLVDSSGNVTILSASSGQRMEITNAKIEIYDASNALLVEFGVF